MPDTLTVDLNRPERNDVQAPASFSATGPFTVRIRNHGRDGHPHLRLDDALARVATVGESNPHVPGGEAVSVTVDVAPGAGPARGRLTVEAGYGAEAAAVDVTVEHATETDTDGVEVGDDLAASTATADPPGSDGDDAGEGPSLPSLPSPTVPSGALLVAAVAVAAVAVAAGAWSLAEDAVVAGGVTVVLVGVLAAVVILLR